MDQRKIYLIYSNRLDRFSQTGDETTESKIFRGNFCRQEDIFAAKTRSNERTPAFRFRMIILGGIEVPVTDFKRVLHSGLTSPARTSKGPKPKRRNVANLQHAEIPLFLSELFDEMLLTPLTSVSTILT